MLHVQNAPNATLTCVRSNKPHRFLPLVRERVVFVLIIFWKEVKKTAFTKMFQGGCRTPEPVQPECDPQEEVL